MRKVRRYLQRIEYAFIAHRCCLALSAMLVFGAVAIHADTAGSPYNPPMEIQVSPGFTLTRTTLTEREIPVLLLAADEAIDTKMPVVIALHGGAMPEVLDQPGMTAKEAWFLPEEFHNAPYILARAGCLVVIFDAWWAGERFRPEYRDMARENPFNAAVRGWTETARDVSLVLDALSEVSGADVARVGVCGRSGGAITALMAARRDKRISTVVSWAGCADVEAFLRSKAPPEVAEQLLSAAPDARKQLQEFDPIYELNALPPRPILLINNRSDPATPVALAQTFYERLLPRYGVDGARLRFSVRDTSEATHKMSEQDYAEGCAWLIRHLVKTSP